MKTATTYRSGHCGVNAHDRCRGRYGGADCACACHDVCPECGQPLPKET